MQVVTVPCIVSVEEKTWSLGQKAYLMRIVQH